MGDLPRFEDRFEDFPIELVNVGRLHVRTLPRRNHKGANATLCPDASGLFSSTRNKGTSSRSPLASGVVFQELVRRRW
jgi:hypothetical protein